MLACHADASCHVGVTRTVKCFNASSGGLAWKPSQNGGCAGASNAKRVRPPTKHFLASPLPSIPGTYVSVGYFRSLPTTVRRNQYIFLFTDLYRYILFGECLSPLLLDNGSQFFAQLATAIYRSLGVHKLTTGGNGDIEHTRHIKAHMLAMLCNEHQNDWGVHLPHVEYAYYNAVSVATGLALNEVHIGRLPRLPLIVIDRSYFGAYQSFDCDQLV